MKLLQTLTLAACATLAVACADGNSTSKNSSKNDSTKSVDLSSVAYNGKIAFVRMDSLMSGYGMYIDMSDEFGKKQQKIQAELTAKGRGLEREAMEYQEKAQKGLITRYQAQSTEEGLQKKQQDIMAYRDRVMGELGQQEAAMSREIFAAVSSFLQEYNVTKGYSMILQTAGSNPVLVADPNLDITTEVLAELNKLYDEKLAAKTDKK
ncbi:MAG: OmpH family outer membrane protein [Mucinivorans sp.]